MTADGDGGRAHAVTDPYRYMEDVKNAEVTAFLRGQGEFARKALDAIPARQALLDRIGVLSEAGETISDVQITGKRIEIKIGGGHA